MKTNHFLFISFLLTLSTLQAAKKVKPLEYTEEELAFYEQDDKVKPDDDQKEDHSESNHDDEEKEEEIETNTPKGPSPSYKHSSFLGDYTKALYTNNPKNKVNHTLSHEEFEKTISSNLLLKTVTSIITPNAQTILLFLEQESPKNYEKEEGIYLPTSPTILVNQKAKKYHKYALTTNGTFNAYQLGTIHTCLFHAVFIKPSPHLIDLVLQFLGFRLKNENPSNPIPTITLIYTSSPICPICASLLEKILDYPLVTKVKEQVMSLKVTPAGCNNSRNTFQFSSLSAYYMNQWLSKQKNPFTIMQEVYSLINPKSSERKKQNSKKNVAQEEESNSKYIIQNLLIVHQGQKDQIEKLKKKVEDQEKKIQQLINKSKVSSSISYNSQSNSYSQPAIQKTFSI